MILRTVGRLTPCFIPLIKNRNEYDCDRINVEKREAEETGFDRVKRMYSINEYGETSVELHSIGQASFVGAFFGACFGGFVKSADAYIYFIENNQATIFKTTMQAKRRLQDYVTVAFAKGAVKWGWRLGLFTGLFSAIATTISVYQQDTTLVQYIIAGTLTGGIFKLHLGLAATCVGAGLGAALSTAGGLAILGILKATGVKMEDIWKALHKIKESRERNYREALEKTTEIKNDPLAIHHEVVIEERGEKKIEDL